MSYGVFHENAYAILGNASKTIKVLPVVTPIFWEWR